MNIKDMSIKNKIRIISFTPLAFMILLSFYIMIKSYNEQISLEEIQKIVLLNTKISELLHETQKERGTSIGFIANKDTKFRILLEKQRKSTDLKIKEFNEIYNSIEIKVFLNNSNILLKKNIKQLQDNENNKKSKEK